MRFMTAWEKYGCHLQGYLTEYRIALFRWKLAHLPSKERAQLVSRFLGGKNVGGEGSKKE